MELNTTFLKEEKIDEFSTSLFGVCIGGGLFLFIVILGVIFWISRERKEDEETRLEAERFRSRRGGRGRSKMMLLGIDEAATN